MKLDSGCEPSVTAIQRSCLCFPLMYRQLQSDFKQYPELGKTGCLFLGKGRFEEACIMLLQGLKKEPTFMQYIKLNELAISQVPLITPVRACQQHVARGEEN